jgi:photosystem II stability/assembly factor-like uncharacterized protein
MNLLSSRLPRLATALLPALSALLFAPSAQANGRFPLADQLIIDPGDPAHMVMRVTYGMLQSVDSGKTWQWTCELAVGYNGTQDPAIGITQDGTLLAGIFQGLSISHDRACSWAFAGDPLTDEYTIDNSVERQNPSHAVAITSSGTMTGFHVILAESMDNGHSWAQAGVPIAEDFIALTVDTAPSRPERVYVSGLVGKSLTPAIEWSDDRGQVWTRVYFPPEFGPGNPYVAAVDPNNADRVYVRISGDAVDRLLLSDDGAQTWAEIFSTTVTQGDLLGFALSPDATKVAVGGPLDGIHMASTVDHVFQQVSQLYTRCLTWSDAGIYACANEFKDGFTLGLSTDEAKTFTSLYHLRELCPLQCPAGSGTADLCGQAWAGVAATLEADPACGAGTSSSSSGSSGASSNDTATSGACACRAGNAPEATGLGFAAAVGMFVAACKRRGGRRTGRVRRP